MAEDSSVGGQIQSMLARLPAPLRIGLTLAAIAVVAWILWTVAVGLLQPWEPLASGLPQAEQARVLEYLRSNAIPYKVEGGSVMVHADRAAELKIDMAGQDMQVGLLPGLERLESVGMGDTERTIDARTQLALQEEIQKALNSLSVIHTSLVRLALPPQRGFLAETQEPAKASVWLTLRPGGELSAEQVRGLQHQIAHSIQNLHADNVSILDHNSRLLSQRSEEGTRLAMIRQREEGRVREAVLHLLEPKVGANSVRVSSTVELERQQRRERRHVIDTDNPAETSFESVEEEESGQSGVAGVPGAEANTGDSLAASGGGSPGGQRSRLEERRQTDYPSSETEVIIPAGAITRRSVAVVIDLRRVEDEEGGVEYVSWGEENLSRWRDALRNAVGIVAQRDNLTLEEDSFEYIHQMEIELQEQRQVEQTRRLYDVFDWSDWTSFIKVPALLLIAFLVVWFVLRPVGKRILSPVLQLPARAGRMPDQLPRTVEELEAEMESRLEEEIELPSREVKKGTILKKRITELAKTEPESFSALIRTWLYE